MAHETTTLGWMAAFNSFPHRCFFTIQGKKCIYRFIDYIKDWNEHGTYRNLLCVEVNGKKIVLDPNESNLKRKQVTVL